MATVGAKRWMRQEYEKMAEAGVFSPGERVELIDGEILTMTPQKSPHATAILLTVEALRTAFGPVCTVRPQLPLALDPLSEPEPDIAVVSGSPRDCSNDHPSSALLIVEVADTTLEYDRQRKGSLYARAGIADYWILNLTDRRLEVYRDPAPANLAVYGWAYRTVQHYTANQFISPLASPQARINVADLLP